MLNSTIKSTIKSTLAAACFATAAIVAIAGLAGPALAGANLPVINAPAALTKVAYNGRHNYSRGKRTYRRQARRSNNRHTRNNRHNRQYRQAPRYRHRRRGYNYFYGGFWHAAPFIFFATAYMPRTTYRDSHVEWCLERYRSYDPRTDRFRANNGRQYRCRSPYR
jgi:hypothetical protein